MFHFRWVAASFILILTFFNVDGSMNVNISEVEASGDNVFVVVMLHYDTYFPSINLTDMHTTFEAALSWLRDEGFPMDKVAVVSWRNTLDSESEYEWFMDTLRRYNVSTDESQFGLYIAPEDAHNPDILSYALETFRGRFRRYPFYVAGVSAGINTYSGLINHGVKLSFFNLWEEGEDYSYRGHSTGDRLFGANWEGSPFQPYKPSKRTVNAPGTTEEDELDIWEAHWITRNPSYAYMAVNSRNWGSIHPSDLLWGDWQGSKVCETSEALDKFRTILDLVDQNSDFNRIMVVSYPVEVSLLRTDNVFEVWRTSIKEFIRRGYKPVDAVQLRSLLDSLEAEPPHTPIYIWFDNLTSSDMVVAGEHTPFALLSSPYGRFIYGRRDPFNDSGMPFVSITSYTTARAYNDSFQSIRELTGIGKLKMNTFIDGVSIDSRWLNDISTITISPGKAIAIEWMYTKSEVPNIRYGVETYLTPHGVLVEKTAQFKRRARSHVSMVHYLTVQSSSPTTILDEGVVAETDLGDVYTFKTNNPMVFEKRLQVNDTFLITARDGYTLGVTIIQGEPETMRVFDEPFRSPIQTLEFTYPLKTYRRDERIRLSYTLTPARDVEDARRLAESTKAMTENNEPGETQTYTFRSRETPTITGMNLSGMVSYIIPIFFTIIMTIVMVKARHLNSKAAHVNP